MLRNIAIPRLLLGLSQGLALYGLIKAADLKIWPSTDLAVQDALYCIAGYAPVYAIVGLGNLRTRTAATWFATIVVLCGAIGFYMGFREPKPEPTYGLFWTSWLNASFGLSILLFISHCLVVAGDLERKRVATFATYFDVAWRLATQFLLAGLFVLLFWGILFLGAGLFHAIGIESFFKTIIKPWFYIPVTSLASSAALHLTDAQTGLVRGARTLLLNLLSWLMPLMTLIAVAFLIALPFTGLDPLWKTKMATSALLGAVAILILLINSHFQDGAPRSGSADNFLSPVRLVAAFMLTPLTALAAYGLWLRVHQYGWTPSRVIGVAVLIVAASHALGYAYAGLTSGPALRRLPATNIASAFVAAACMLALLTPLADPARISVASQVGRLEAGTVDPDKFDFNFLRFGSARFGKEALERLSTKPEGPNAMRIADKATRARTSSSPYGSYVALADQPPATAETRRANVTVIRAGTLPLPADFLQQDWNNATGNGSLPACLTKATGKCEALVVDLKADGGTGVIILTTGIARVFARNAQGSWESVGSLSNAACSGVLDSLRNGTFELAPSTYRNIMINGIPLSVTTGCQR